MTPEPVALAQAADGSWGLIAVMAATTYAIRVLPFVLLRREIRHPVVRAFLHYVPYATLSAMTVPAAILATPNVLSGLLGLLTAGLLAYRGVNLLATAAAAATVVWLVEYFC